jgi:hypothetical protein
VTSLKKVVSVAALLVVVLAAVAAIAWQRRIGNRVKFDTPYQAVLLDNNQVYYGKIQGVGTDYPVLTDVFYVQNVVNPQTKEVTNVLVRRGKEWHGPDRMVINSRHIILIEPVSPNSKVAQLIAEARSKGSQ